MIKYKKCIRCESENVDLLYVNSRISLNYPEKKDVYAGLTSQKILNPTNALVCKDCGHIEFLIDWEK